MSSTHAGLDLSAEASSPWANEPQVQAGWALLDCSLPAVRPIFEATAHEAIRRLTPETLLAYWSAGHTLGRLGRGAEPLIAWLTYWPEVVEAIGDENAQVCLEKTMALLMRMHKSPNSRAMAPLLFSLGPTAHCLGSFSLLKAYLHSVSNFMDATTGSIHGRQASLSSPGLIDMLAQTPSLLQKLSLEGWQAWLDFGQRAYASHPPQQVEYFSLRSTDSLAVIQRERHGLLMRDAERILSLSLKALWNTQAHFEPLPTAQIDVALGLQEKSVLPCIQIDRHSSEADDIVTMGLPDVLDDLSGVRAINRYLLMTMHMAAHKRWSTPCIADNWSPSQRVAVEWFEDTRIDLKLMTLWPGLRHSMMALYPPVKEGECNEATHACLLHRLSIFSRSVLDPSIELQDAGLSDWRSRFIDLLNDPAVNTERVAQLALQFVAKTRRPTDSQAEVYFTHTQVDWRDDNRHLWRFIEEGDEEDTSPSRSATSEEELKSLPPQLYPEWDEAAGNERPDWVRVYEFLHPSGQASDIDQLLLKHDALSKKLKRVIDQLKPQGRTRTRHLEFGSELDLDLAIAAQIDIKAGLIPGQRIEQHFKHIERDLSVQLVMDLSASLNEEAPGTRQTVLQISQEAVSILAWALSELGDSLAIGGFHSNTRHDVRYMHIKGFEESWAEETKARLAAIQPAYSTRMGAAIRHASRPLMSRKSAKKMLLVLTDGEPSDVDVSDPQYLTHDARQIVKELQAQGVFVWCIQLHPDFESSVRTIFGDHCTLVDQIQKLPEILANLFIRLTR